MLSLASRQQRQLVSAGPRLRWEVREWLRSAVEIERMMVAVGAEHLAPHASGWRRISSWTEGLEPSQLSGDGNHRVLSKDLH